MQQELLYQVALTLVPNIGYVHARTLIQHFGCASAVLKAHRSELERIEGIGTVRAASITAFNAYREAEAEVAFLEKYKVRPLFITDPSYPQRLLHCYDAPVLLYYKGTADLNASRIVAIVGTRNNTDYGKQVTETLVKALSELQVILISGLAYGIDGIAHKCALKHNIPTVGVVGHGLDQVYPAAHKGLAKDMLKEGGGLLTEYRSKTPPDKHNFPGRNRIVAGISDAVILVETGIKGGSMITAEIADSYNRDVFAVPGKITDPKSEGCNYLIRSNKAMLLDDAETFLDAMGWKEKALVPRQRQTTLFVQLNADEQKIVALLREKETMHIDELNLRSGLSNSAVAGAVLNLEMQGLIAGLPGRMYKLI
ncbi:MAG TPA: DNA-processing protein DprA [Chitinophagaceae bacterium]|nr:DNA-processing protein DprA [Chitinophagaceae bacterium]